MKTFQPPRFVSRLACPALFCISAGLFSPVQAAAPVAAGFAALQCVFRRT